MQSGIVRLLWTVDSAGYELVERGERGRNIVTHRPAGTYIVGRGGKPQPLNIGLQEHDIFIELANTPMTDQGVLAFCNRWGQLGFGEEQALSEFFEARQSMAWSLAAKASTVRRALKSHGFGSLKIEIENNRLVFRANAMMQFCSLQRLQALEGGVDIVRCPACKAFLSIHHKQGRAKKQCSNACKQAAYRKRVQVKKAVGGMKLRQPVQ